MDYQWFIISSYTQYLEGSMTYVCVCPEWSNTKIQLSQRKCAWVEYAESSLEQMISMCITLQRQKKT